MANAHPDEKALYDRIRCEEIKVPLCIWDMIYRYIGDDVTAITQITLAYSRYNESIDIKAAKKILGHTRNINTVVDKILQAQKNEAHGEAFGVDPLPDSGAGLHPVIKELFTHYIGNDVHGINMIVGFHLDPLDENPVPVEDALKILEKTRAIKQFMDRLSAATNQEISVAVRKNAPEA